MKMSFGIIGGDRRQAELARLLAADQHAVVAFGLREWNPPDTNFRRSRAMYHPTDGADTSL